MRVRDIGRPRRWLQRAWLATQRRAVILLYHRVAGLSSDPQLLSVTPQHFAEQLEHVRKHYHPMSLIEVGCALAVKCVPHRAVVITFDDGYADNLWNANPLLEQYDVPATVFMTTAYVGQNREFWWDELEKLLLLPERLPEKLALSIDSELHEWDLFENKEQGQWGMEQEDLHPVPHTSSATLQWNVIMKFCPTPRHKLYKELHHLLCPLNDEVRKKVLSTLAQWAGVSRDGRPTYRALNPDELKVLSDGRLVEIGSHSITHPLIAIQPVEVQRIEIFESKQYLENILGHSVRSFSYPYGGVEEVGDEAVQLVREAGYKIACANFSTLVTRYSNSYWLPRYLVRDWDGKEFARRLQEWFHG